MRCTPYSPLTTRCGPRGPRVRGVFLVTPPGWHYSSLIFHTLLSYRLPLDDIIITDNCRTRRMDIIKLPSEILESVAANIARTLLTPRMVLSSISQLQCLIQLIVLHSHCLFRCTVFCSATAARKVGEGMVVQREWDLHERSYYIMTMLRACVECGNNHALFLLGLVKSQPNLS
jgi:hypothetical protein